MSTDNDVTELAVEAKPVSKKSSIPAERVRELTAGLPQYDKASFLVVGHKNGVRLALPKTGNVSRAYFYGNGDYSLVPNHAAVSVFTKEHRKQRRLGGIMAEVLFDDLTQATEALVALIEVVRQAAPPAPKGAKAPKAPRKAKDKAVETGAGETTDAQT